MKRIFENTINITPVKQIKEWKDHKKKYNSLIKHLTEIYYF